MAEELDVLPSKIYIDHLITTGKKGAADTYGSLLVSYQRWLRQKKGIGLNDSTVTHLDEYVSELSSDSTVKITVAAVKGYFKHRYSSLPIGDPRVMDEMQRFNQLQLLRPKKKRKQLKKISLNATELKQLLAKMKKAGVSDNLYAGMVVLFYFGARAGEFAHYLHTARVDFSKHEMILMTEKTLVERYLAWHPTLDPYLETWYKFVMSKAGGLPYPGEWLTKTLKYEMGTRSVDIGGVSVTSRTCRRTFETQMRVLGVQDIIIRAVLGHTDGSMSDVYTDWTEFAPLIKDAMVDSHYMIVHGVI